MVPLEALASFHFLEGWSLFACNLILWWLWQQPTQSVVHKQLRPHGWLAETHAVIPSKEFSDIWWISNNFWDGLTLLLVLTLAWNQMLDKKGWWQEKDISCVCITQQIHAEVKHNLSRKRTNFFNHCFHLSVCKNLDFSTTWTQISSVLFSYSCRWVLKLIVLVWCG